MVKILREVSSMIFSKDIDPRCAYCKHGTALDDHTIMCLKKGVTSPADQCRRFRYDPLKRLPPKPQTLTFPKFSEEDFTL